MPRKPKKEKTSITVVVNGKPVGVSLTPPSGRRKSWYAYWKGLGFSKSTEQSNLDDAIRVAEDMVRNGGRRTIQEDTVLSEEEFVQLQKQHFSKKKNPKAKERAAKSLFSLLNAIDAFRSITGLRPITLATPDDCERFQHDALALPKNWRSKHPKSPQFVESISPTTIDKWSRALQAAWERANRNAGKKCVRGVVPEQKLFTDNPWNKFTWIEKRDKPIRQFASDELLAILDYFEAEWSGVTVAQALAQVYLWSWGRRSEISSLTWDALRHVFGEYHFEVTGKWGVRKWFRIPDKLFQLLNSIRTDSPFVFAAYNQQLRTFHRRGPRPWLANRVTDSFEPHNLGDWFYNRVSDWSEGLPNGSACVHVFRKTTLQYARSGEDVNRQVADDASVSEGVMMTNYVQEMDPELRSKSNRTFHRIAASLSPNVAERYGYKESDLDALKRRLRVAVEAEDWQLVSRLIAEVAKRDRQGGQTA